MTPQTAVAACVQQAFNSRSIVSSHGTEMEAAITAVSVHPQRFSQHEKFHPRSGVMSDGREGRKESGGCRQCNDFTPEEIYYVCIKVNHLWFGDC